MDDCKGTVNRQDIWDLYNYIFDKPARPSDYGCAFEKCPLYPNKPAETVKSGAQRNPLVGGCAYYLGYGYCSNGDRGVELKS